MKFASSLSSELREKYGRRNARPVTGDSVRIARGGFKGIEGKVTGVDSETGKVFIEGVTREKTAGGKTSPVPIDASKVVITNLNLDDKIRRRKVTREEEGEEVVAEEAPVATAAPSKAQEEEAAEEDDDDEEEAA